MNMTAYENAQQECGKASESACCAAVDSTETGLHGDCLGTAGTEYQSSGGAVVAWRQGVVSCFAEVEKMMDEPNRGPAVAEIAREQAPCYDARMAEPTSVEWAAVRRQTWQKDYQALEILHRVLYGGTPGSWKPWMPVEAEDPSAGLAYLELKTVALVRRHLGAPRSLALWVSMAPTRWD